MGNNIPLTDTAEILNNTQININSKNLVTNSYRNSNYLCNEEYIKVNKWPIGQGAFGKVWIVKLNVPKFSPNTTANEFQSSEKLFNYFAMKEINLDLHVFKICTKNLNYALQEGGKMQNLNHKNVVAYINSNNDLVNKKAYLIMEYANGGSLRDRISFQINKRDYTSSNNPTIQFFNENLIWFWLLQIMDGISYIHNKDVIHRDIKPDNIFIDASNGTCKLGDFGLAKILEDKNQDCVSQVGTPAYMPPEVLEIRQAQLQYQSADTINNKTAICSLYSKKGDIYRLVFLFCFNDCLINLKFSF